MQGADLAAHILAIHKAVGPDASAGIRLGERLEMGSFGDYQDDEQRFQEDVEWAQQLREAETLVNVADGPGWIALDVALEYNCALFISQDIIAQKAYHEPGGSITWANCSLRTWLNGSFLSSLPAQIRSRVMEGTSDQVFLLTFDEVRKYFKSDSDRVAKFNGSTGWWWLRSPGYYPSDAAFVSTDGYVNDHGLLVYHADGGVRPALWLNLEV